MTRSHVLYLVLDLVRCLGLLTLLVAGCDARSELAVDLFTDYAPGWEFDEVVVSVDGHEEATLRAAAGDGYALPVRVAELSGVAPGRHSIVVSLARRGRRVALQETVVRVTGAILVRAILTRSCEGVSCPGADDRVSATACLGGVCVDPECAPDGSDAGSSASMCVADECDRGTDCAPRGCTEVACDRGACLWLPIDENCGDHEYCDGALGACVVRPGSDAGTPDAGTPDAGMPDAGPPPAAPDLTLAATSPTALASSWTSVTAAATYEIALASSPDFEGTSPTVTERVESDHDGLSPGRRYYARVRAIDALGRAGAWSEVVSAVTPIGAPGTPSVSVTIPGAARPASACCWVTPPGGSQWYYAQGHASSDCPSGTSIEYRFQAQYTSPTTLYGWTGWGGPDAFMIGPRDGYGVRFFAQARCVTTEATSPVSGTGVGCRMRSGAGC